MLYDSTYFDRFEDEEVDRRLARLDELLVARQAILRLEDDLAGYLDDDTEAPREYHEAKRTLRRSGFGGLSGQ